MVPSGLAVAFHKNLFRGLEEDDFQVIALVAQLLEDLLVVFNEPLFPEVHDERESLDLRHSP